MLKLAVTIDVEEEGLFSGSYQTRDCPVKNLDHLKKLDPLFKERSIRPTLLVAYQAAKDPEKGDLIMELSERWGAEVAAHLHHWNTPPLIDLPHKDPAPSDLIPKHILEEKLSNLLGAIESWGVKPESFRMGRFNLGPSMLQALQDTTIKVDSSVAPLRRQYGGPNHMDAPNDPYYPDLMDPALPGASRVLEVPMTIVPVLKNIEKWLGRLDRAGYSGAGWREVLAEKVISIPAQPMWTGLGRMKLAVNLHSGRGGRVINTFFHSSELMPMGNPKHPSDFEIDLFLKKLDSFFRWMGRTHGYQSLTLRELKEFYPVNPRLEQGLSNDQGSLPEISTIQGEDPSGDQEDPMDGRLEFEPLTAPNQAPVKLVIIIQDMEFGGTQRYVGYLLQNIDRRIFQPELWLLRGGEDLLPFATEVRAPIKAMCDKLWVTPWAIVKLFFTMRRLAPDIVYTITGVPNGWGRIFAKALKTPVIIGGYRSMVPQPFEKWFWKLSDRIICNAQMSKRILVEDYKVDPEIISVIPNAVDTERFTPDGSMRSTAPLIVSVARLVNEKDPLTLLKAMDIVRQEAQEATLEIVGGGYLENEVRRFIDKRGLGRNVKLSLSQPDVLSRLRKAWLFVISSKMESSPNSVLEAMSAGLPVVGTRVGGIPEIVRDGQTGIIVAPRNPEQLAAAILELLRDRTLREEMGDRAREITLKHHSPRIMARATEAVFKNSMHKSASKAGLK
jgi:glycosyltransferase involved in cell wall biosynthesis